VSYQALNAVTSAMLTVKGTPPSQTHTVFVLRLSVSENEGLSEGEGKKRGRCVSAFVNNCRIIRTSQRSKWALWNL